MKHDLIIMNLRQLQRSLPKYGSHKLAVTEALNQLTFRPIPEAIPPEANTNVILDLGDGVHVAGFMRPDGIFVHADGTGNRPVLPHPKGWRPI